MFKDTNTENDIHLNELGTIKSGGNESKEKINRTNSNTKRSEWQRILYLNAVEIGTLMISYLVYSLKTYLENKFHNKIFLFPLYLCLLLN